MSVLDDIGGLLQTAGIGTLGTTLFAGILPESTSTGGTVTAVLESPAGLPPIRRMSSVVGRASVIAERPRIQVQARAGTYQAARDKVMDVMEELDNLREETINGTRYVWIDALTRPPRFLRRDENDRVIAYADFEIWKVPST